MIAVGLHGDATADSLAVLCGSLFVRMLRSVDASMVQCVDLSECFGDLASLLSIRRDVWFLCNFCSSSDRFADGGTGEARGASAGFSLPSGDRSVGSVVLCGGAFFATRRNFDLSIGDSDAGVTDDEGWAIGLVFDQVRSRTDLGTGIFTVTVVEEGVLIIRYECIDPQSALAQALHDQWHSIKDPQYGTAHPADPPVPRSANPCPSRLEACLDRLGCMIELRVPLGSAAFEKEAEWSPLLLRLRARSDT